MFARKLTLSGILAALLLAIAIPTAEAGNYCGPGHYRSYPSYGYRSYGNYGYGHHGGYRQSFQYGYQFRSRPYGYANPYYYGR
jgi:hypothetical protein